MFNCVQTRQEDCPWGNIPAIHVGEQRNPSTARLLAMYASRQTLQAPVCNLLASEPGYKLQSLQTAQAKRST